MQALGIVAKLKDDNQIKDFVKTEWSAAQDNAEDRDYESWYGSEILLTAAERGFITHDDALNRMSPRFFGKAAKRLGRDTASEIALRIDASIKRALSFQPVHIIPDIEQNTSDERELNPPFYNLPDITVTDSYDPNQIFERLTETPDAFKERQKRKYDAFRAFVQDLTRFKAQIILDNIGFEGFSAIVESNSELAASWYKLFIKLPKNQLHLVHNLGLILASVIGTINPENAKELFQLLSQSQPIIHFTFGYEGVFLDAISVWAGSNKECLNEERFKRLDSALNDHEISMEVLAALRNSKRDILEYYVDQKLSKGEPTMIARALMVSGFSDESSHASDVLKRYQNNVGFIGRVHKAASYAYERNIWARGWFEKMCKAGSNEDFWRYTVLFTKITRWAVLHLAFGLQSLWKSIFTI